MPRDGLGEPEHGVRAAPGHADARLRLLSFPAPVSGRAVTIDFKQSIAASEQLVTGGYGKVLMFTLSATTP